MKKALLIIDIQKDYFPGGKMELEEPVKAAENAASLLHAFRQSKETVIHVQHTSYHEGATFFLPNTEGIEIHPLLTPIADEVVIPKNYPNSFKETKLEAYLRTNNITELVICGMMTHICIDTTVRRGSDLYLKMTLAGDACATRKLEYDGEIIPAKIVQATYLASLQRFATVKKTEEILNNLGVFQTSKN